MIALPLDMACQLAVVASAREPGSWPDAMRALAGAGYARVVLPPLERDVVDLQAIGDSVRACGLVPIAVAGQNHGADVGSPDPDIRRRGWERLEEALMTAVDVGADQLSGVPYGPLGNAGRPVDGATFERAAQAVGKLADRAAGMGVTVTFEVLNRYETALVNTASDAVRFVEASGSDNLRIHLDTFHMAIEEASTNAAITQALPWLGYLELGQSGRGPLGVGSIDIPGTVAHALDAGYAGRWGIEAFSRGILAEEAANRLAIWRGTYPDPVSLTEEAVLTIRQGWARSITGRRAQRESRLGSS